MPDKRNRRAEWLAKRLLTRWLGATVTDRDVPGGPSGLYDFDLCFRDGRNAAVEVRTCVDPVAAGFDAALDQHAVVEPAVGLTRVRRHARGAHIQGVQRLRGLQRGRQDHARGTRGRDRHHLHGRRHTQQHGVPPRDRHEHVTGGDDEQELSGYFEKLSEGGTIWQPLAMSPWGDKFGMLTDRFGVEWMVNITGQQA